MSVASHAASRIAHEWPTTYFLGQPTTAVASVGTSFVAAGIRVPPPYPDDGLHAHTRFNIGVPPSSTPQVVPTPKEVGSVVEVMLVIVLIVVLAGRVIVLAYDAAGRLLARAGP